MVLYLETSTWWMSTMAVILIENPEEKIALPLSNRYRFLHLVSGLSLLKATTFLPNDIPEHWYFEHK
jgi:hypothetical protein